MKNVILVFVFVLCALPSLAQWNGIMTYYKPNGGGDAVGRLYADDLLQFKWFEWRKFAKHHIWQSDHDHALWCEWCADGEVDAV